MPPALTGIMASDMLTAYGSLGLRVGRRRVGDLRDGEACGSIIYLRRNLTCWLFWRSNMGGAHLRPDDLIAMSSRGDLARHDRTTTSPVLRETYVRKVLATKRWRLRTRYCTKY